MTDLDFAPDLEEGEARLSDRALRHFGSRVVRAAHILEELILLGVEPTAELKVLFAGCGIGFIPYVIARHTAWLCIGGELDEECIGRHPWVRERVRYVRLDATAMPFADDSFDVVICNHVIEHVPAWEVLAQELHRVVRRGGLAYLATPNIYRPKVPLKIMLRSKKHLDRDTRIDLHLGFGLHELKKLFRNFSHLRSLNRIHTSINAPSYLRPVLPLVPEVMYDYLLPTNVIIGRK